MDAHGQAGSVPPDFAQVRIGKSVLVVATALVSYLLVGSKIGQLFIREVAAVSSQLLIFLLRLNQDRQTPATCGVLTSGITHFPVQPS
jgi:hypothetical protein